MSEQHSLYLASLLRAVGALARAGEADAGEKAQRAAAVRFAEDRASLWEAMGIPAGALLAQVRAHGVLDRASTLAIGGAASEGPARPELVPLLFRLGNPEAKDPPLFPGAGLHPEHFPAQGQGQEWRSPWEKFLAEFERLPPGEPGAFCESLLSLLEKYADRVRGPQADVSIYAHARSRTGIALGLREASEFLLIGGDVSGIQTFIYDLVSKNAAKLLKGRSFYLQLLVDSILFRLQGDLGLHTPQVVYASGGGFLLLAPRRASIENDLETLRAEFEEKLFAAHGLQLGLSLGWTALSQEELAGEGLGRKRSELAAELAAQKQQRAGSLLGRDYTAFFEGVERGGHRDRDPITNEEFQDGEDLVEMEGLGMVKRSTWEQIRLGVSLRQSPFRIVSDRQLHLDGRQQEIDPAGLGVWHSFLLQMPEKLPPPGPGQRIQVQRINHDEAGGLGFLPEGAPQPGIGYGFFWYGGNRYPVDEAGNPAMLENLVGMDAEDAMHRLGVLRMDVDNLGSLFNLGLHEGMHLARIGTLSRALDFFFKAWLNHRITNHPDWRDRALLVYAGGDDLFLLGRWDMVADIAAEVRKAFGGWTGGNPQLGLSGGLATVGPKFPVIRGAELAGIAEKRAKMRAVNGRQKDAFCLFGRALRWDTEYQRVQELRGKLAELLAGGVHNSLLQKLMTHDAQRQRQERDQMPERWRWTLAWDISRLRDRIPKEQQELKRILDDLLRDCAMDLEEGQPCNANQEDTDTSGRAYCQMELAATAARILELQNRTEH